MNDVSRFFIGIDGGGTGCRVAISDHRGAVIATSSGGPANYTSDPKGTVENVRAALAMAAADAGLSLMQVESAPTHVGLAGIITENDAARVAAALPLTRCVVSNDQTTTVAGALGAQNGAVISIGTGSFVAIKRDAHIRYIGGWGLQLGDEASGAWLGREALKRCTYVLDGLVDTSDFIETLSQRFNHDPGQIIAFVKEASAETYASIAPNVIAAAKAQDPNATLIVQSGASYLNLCLASADLQNDEVLCLTGGLGASYEEWLDATYRPRLTGAQGNALDGALFLARQTTC